MKASGSRAAMAWEACQPVQCAGTTTPGASSASASTVGAMTGANIGPLRWTQPTRAQPAESAASIADVGAWTSVPDAARSLIGTKTAATTTTPPTTTSVTRG